jgi:hypothetical protein
VTVATKSDFSEFYCCAEWHISRFKWAKEAAALIYPWALRLCNSGEKRMFRASVAQAAEFFRIGMRTAQRAFEYLREAGVFILIESGKDNYEASTFEILTHQEWAAENPGQCTIKYDNGWAATEDKLGPGLFTLSGGKIKFKPFQIHLYRKTISDEYVIKLAFSRWYPEYRDQQQGRKWRNAVGYEFGQYLKSIVVN